MMTKAIIWSNVGCHFCEMAKTLLTKKGIEYEERNIAKDWKTEQLLEAVPNARTVPQIFVDDKYIGSYDNLVEYFNQDN
jgi:glutaredoxin 3